jgi:hypothetical protein
LTYMVRIIPLNLRSQKPYKGVPHARARTAAAAGRGMARRGRQAASGRAWCGVVLLWENPCHLVHESRTFRITVQPQVWVFPSRSSARTEKREGRCLQSPCRSRPCTVDRQLGFWGASTRLPKTSSSSWRHDKRSWTRIWILRAHERV